MDEKTLLEVKDLSIYFNLREGVLKAIDGISFNVDRNSTVGIVGESGSGKSVTAQAIMRILPETAEIKTLPRVCKGKEYRIHSNVPARVNRLRSEFFVLCSTSHLCTLHTFYKHTHVYTQKERK